MAPYVFILGFFFSFLSWSIYETRCGTGASAERPEYFTVGVEYGRDFAAVLTSKCSGHRGALIVAARHQPVSMHMLYRSRRSLLLGCFESAPGGHSHLPAFQSTRRFNVVVSPCIWIFKERPLLLAIINATLNLVAGNELAWQQRKAASFVFTPLCATTSSQNFPQYCETNANLPVFLPGSPWPRRWRSPEYLRGQIWVITLPAAKRSNDRFQCVRLGWWLGKSPPGGGYSRNQRPLNVLSSLMLELFALTTTVVSISIYPMAGHFENLGIYELVRRRCRFIVASDAEEDRTFGFSGLGRKRH